MEYRFLLGDRARIPGILSELLQLNVDVIISGTPPVLRALKQATKTIPIVMVTTQDPVAAGYVDSLARPGGNITGLTRLTRDLSEKRLELLKRYFPRHLVSVSCGMRTGPMLVSVHENCSSAV